MGESLPLPLLKSVAERAESVVRAAGVLALGWFRPGARTTARIESKPGGSPVTEADFAVDALLSRELPRSLDNRGRRIGCVSEEVFAADATASPPADEPFWLVDPIDGTRAFLAGEVNWAVSVALVVGGRPSIGLVWAPARDTLYVAVAGGGARLNGKILERTSVLPDPCRVAGPRPAIEFFARQVAGATIAPRIPSLALRLCAVADGALDAAIASAGAHCWDVAAADLILQEAGAALLDGEGRPLVYNSRPIRRGALVAAPVDSARTLAAHLPIDTEAAA